MFSLINKIIIVTGGNGLLGRQIVNRLKVAGATVFSGDVQIDEANEFEQYLDITNEESVKQLIKDIVSRYGKIDGWVNNAYPRTKDWGNKVEDVRFESWRANIDMHLNGYFLCSKLALEQMKTQGFGCLLNMSSIYGVVAPDFTVYDQTSMTMPVAYAAIKGALVNLTRYLAAYYGPHNIRVNSISPGGIFDNQNEIFVSNYNKKVPLRKMGEPEDIAAAAHFLLADDAAYITGHNLMVDGGWSIV
jgi:NAD(P)-dependent dehydrogenase (short-subunit alcohol dehydrogenase family)